MRVFYLTWGETPRLAGVYKSQVINLICKFPSDIKIDLICGLPIVHSGLFREKFKFFGMLQKIRSKLKYSNGSSFTIIPIFAFQTIIYPKRWSFFFLSFLSDIFFIFLIKKKNPDIIHCRGYYSTYFALNLRDRFSFNYKVIFDPRGLFPEETLLLKGFAENSFCYNKLKKIEKWNIEKCDIILSVSETMTDYYRLLGARDIRTIYLSSSFKNNLKIKKLDVDNIKFCYVGALSNDSWHKTNILIDLYKVLYNFFPTSILTIITNSEHAEIVRFLPDYLKRNIVLKSCSNPEAVLTELDLQDIGLMSYFIPNNSIEHKVANTVFAIKTVEYLASCMPVIVNKFCGGASSYIFENKLGIVYDPISFIEINKISITDLIYDFDYHKFSKKISSFSYENNVGRYLDTYKYLKNVR
jgi:hypothetical protein